jgi:hypothetical protein
MNSYKITRGWVSENKHTGCGDGETSEIRTAPTLDEAEKHFAEMVAKCRGTEDRGQMLYRDTVELEEVNEEGEPVGQPVKSFRSK